MTKCTATTTKDNQPCQAWAVADTDPALCAAHGGGKAPVGAPDANQNAVKHGFYRTPTTAPNSIADASLLLADNIAQLGQYISENLSELSIDEIARLSQVHGQNLSRYVRMKRDQEDLDGGSSSELQTDIANALTLAGLQLGIELVPKR